jgi:hypothetical protein
MVDVAVADEHQAATCNIANCDAAVDFKAINGVDSTA